MSIGLAASGQTQGNVTVRPTAQRAPAVLTPASPAPAPARPSAGKDAGAPGPAPAPGTLDPLTVMQQLGIDPVANADAEFDPPVVALGGRATYRIVITAMSESIVLPEKLPAPKGLELVPASSAQSFMPWGQKVQPMTTYNFSVKAPTVGVYTMPPFSVSANGRAVGVPQARFAVVEPGEAPARESPRLLIELPSGEYYVGQSIPVRVVLVDPGDNRVQAMVQPQVEGQAFMIEQGLGRQRRELSSYGGRLRAAFINELFAIPIKSGEHILTAKAFAYVTRVTTNPATGSSIASPLLNSDPVSLSVKRLPKEGELPGFTGAIGVLRLEPPRLSTNEVPAGDPVILTVAVSGEGNLTRLVPPKLERTWDWQTFPPVSELSAAYLIQQRGSTLFTYTLIPLSDQVKATPPIPFSYFDPREGVYTDLTIPPVPIKVTAAPMSRALQSQMPSLTGPIPDDTSHPEGEREWVMTGLAETPGRRVSNLAPLQQRPGYLLLQLAPAIALWGLWFWDRRRRYLALHPEVVLKRRARRGLRHELRLARRAAAARDTSGFVLASVNAMRQACAPHAAANPQALVCADVLAELPPRQRQGEQGEAVRKLFAAADEVRFVAGTSDGATLLTLRPALERILAEFRKRL